MEIHKPNNKVNDRMMNLILRARKSTEELANYYHDGGNWGDHLTGYCGIASRFLINIARSDGIFARLVCGTFDGMTHCWVECKGFCIDITISQFDNFHNKAYRICRIGSDFYNTHYIAELSGKAAISQQKKWDDGQSYDSYSSLLWKIYKNRYLKA